MFEHRTEPLLPRRLFLHRLAWSTAFGLLLIIVSLFIGMMGYHTLEGLSWLDAFLNSAMLLGGMGPIGELHHDSSKLFAGFFALYCGLAVILVAGIMLSPVVHRFFHKLHLNIEDK